VLNTSFSPFVHPTQVAHPLPPIGYPPQMLYYPPPKTLPAPTFATRREHNEEEETNCFYQIFSCCLFIYLVISVLIFPNVMICYFVDINDITDCGEWYEDTLIAYFILRAIFFVALPCMIYSDVKGQGACRKCFFTLLVAWLIAYGIYGIVFLAAFDDEEEECIDKSGPKKAARIVIIIDVLSVIIPAIFSVIVLIYNCYERQRKDKESD
jgi:hypothetical protein